MYFMVAYELWPQLTGCAPLPAGLDQGAALAVVRRHDGAHDALALVGLLGMPRRMAYYDYTHPALQPQAWTRRSRRRSAG